jgi:hypothetical protein
VEPYVPNDHRNTEKLGYTPHKYNFVHAALAMNEYSEPPDYPAGPQWAIFDADAVAREGWKVVPPYVDPDGYFFSGNTLPELAAAIKNEYQAKPMSGDILQATVDRYNSLSIKEWTKITPGRRLKCKIQKPPFYAALGTVIVHDTRCGLRINARCRGRHERPSHPGLYCAGESAGGFNPAWHGALRDPGIYLRHGCGEAAATMKDRMGKA